MIEGQCLCGSVRYQYAGEIGPIVCCHCQQCRQAQGSAFAAIASVNRPEFVWTTDTSAIHEYESSPGKWRGFCSHCGSPLYSRLDKLPELLRLRLGSVTTPLSKTISHHIFAASKATWYTIDDHRPKYRALETGDKL